MLKTRLVVEVALILFNLALERGVVSGRMLDAVAIGAEEYALLELFLDLRPALVGHIANLEVFAWLGVMKL